MSHESYDVHRPTAIGVTIVVGSLAAVALLLFGLAMYCLAYGVINAVGTTIERIFS